MDKKYAEYLLVKTRQDYNRIAEYFSSTRSFLWEELIPLTEYIKPGDNVLDLGCGNGRLYSFLKKRGIKYTGIDSSERMIEIAKEKNQEGDPKFEVVEALDLPFSENSFDKVYSVAVLHHIPSSDFRLEFMEEIKRVLKSKGKLVLTVWNLAQIDKPSLIKYTILRLFGKSKLDPKDVFYPWKNPEGKILAQRYVHCFSKTELEELAKEAGLKVKDSGFLARGKSQKANIYLVAEKV
jgi:ubiquinone/menaquinone biosynthesis C-methylase UbiE